MMKIDQSLFEELIRCEENENLDFKREYYNFQDKKKRLEFILDITAMANSSLYEDAYIICGIADDKTLMGVSKNEDIRDADWRTVFSNYLSHDINFKIFKHTHDGDDFIIVKIPKEQDKRPFMFKSEGTYKCTKENKDKSVFDKGKIYYRFGSQNKFADNFQTIERIIGGEYQKRQGFQNKDIIDPIVQVPRESFVGSSNVVKNDNKKVVNNNKVEKGHILTGDNITGNDFSIK